MGDLEAVFAIVSNPEVVKYLPENVRSIDQVREAFEWFFDCYEKNRPDRIIKFTVAVELKSEQKSHRLVRTGTARSLPPRRRAVLRLRARPLGQGCWYRSRAGHDAIWPRDDWPAESGSGHLAEEPRLETDDREDGADLSLSHDRPAAGSAGVRGRSVLLPHARRVGPRSRLDQVFTATNTSSPGSLDPNSDLSYPA